MKEVKIKKENLHKKEIKLAERKAAKPLLWIGIVSIVMLFAGLTSAYVVRAQNGNWQIFELPPILIISTALIVTSSLTMYLAQIAIRKDNYKLTNISLFLTLMLGFAFFYTQYQGWQELAINGVYFAGKKSNASGSFLIIIAFLHLMHMVGGLIALIVSLTKSLLKKYSSADSLGIELTAIYWHFLDILWVYLFLFLYFYR
ncbi:MAG: cytochrome c oxidase subunit 3 [Bacteroidota bacterium]|nr:cytochrome c oxidase subunit 3 [Bacteroidota bacterium]MDP3147228.1 cytochrome c oxidase subunit 3 [Bacteroidota bacterium]MDP3557698.1 cytochrome c oxidase subunit 3 [Bacteroidota bacterium]